MDHIAEFQLVSFFLEMQNRSCRNGDKAVSSLSLDQLISCKDDYAKDGGLGEV